MASCLGVGVSLFGASVRKNRHSWGVRVRSEGGASADSVSAVVNGASVVREEGSWSSIDKGNGWLKSKAAEKKIKLKDDVPEKLEPFWDDGYGTVTVKDYFDAAKDFTQHPDGGPPRWFCPVASGSPLKGSPILLFLPGMDGTGCGLILHHKALGKAFEVRCLHIPVQDRTPFEGLVKLVEETIRSEHACSPNKPIYLVGDSFGGCLALAVASRNPKIDLVLILSNPATSFGRSQLQPLFPFLGAMPDVLHETVPYVLSFIMGEPFKMATVNVESKLPPMQRFEKVSQNLTALLPNLSDLASIIPKDTLLWKLKLLKSAAAYANSRLHAVNAEVLVLASGKDNMVPSGDESRRLRKSLQNCTVRYFKENGHTLLLEDGIGLLTVIRGAQKYRRSRKHDAVLDYLPPSLAEYNYAFTQVTGLFHFLTGSTMFSTLGDGTVVKGLSGVPNEGPVLLVGYHNLLGLELTPLVEGFLREKGIVVRGVAHPELFLGNLESESPEVSLIDWVKVFGAVPVTANNLYKLLSQKAHVLLYPGGAREALHYKGEEYKLFWPNQQEFVRMAARFGATIVPFGAVGEDDIAQMLLDYNDLIKIPMVSDYIREANQNSAKVRDADKGEVGSQNLFPPLLFPKIPGRFYYLFGKPIVTKGREEILKDKNNANQLYDQVKSEVEHILAYLIKKRKEDPYRNFIDRTVYKAIYSSQHEVPTFDL
ncbi:acyltransferase-like protein [Cucumis melo var. makuwa]|uniref:Acyltransferase-like protein n=1 Tax=Cucumis melo var. makuwa TaxID=1194695 RepID=A0A5D3D4C8_CUCMM|nr:acyltransferase-like protein [Cucumis melo var. makuwa]